MPICSVCNKEAECRIRTDKGGYGPVDVQTCQDCHDKEILTVKAENRRLGSRQRIKKWSELTNEGAYSEVR